MKTQGWSLGRHIEFVLKLSYPTKWEYPLSFVERFKVKAEM